MKTLQDLFLRVDVWIYLAMGVIFLTGVILCILPVRRIQRALRRAHTELPARRADGSYLYYSPDFLHCRAIDGCWERFLSNFDMMRKQNAVCEAADFLNPQTVIHEPGHSAYGAMIPGLLTTLGILGSFYGIVTGLSTLDLSTTETMSQSIAVLISGMRTAFNTSIVGALLAILFQLIRRMTIGGAERTLRAFVRSCQAEIQSQLTPDATLMQTLHAILTELRAIREARQI